MVSGSGHLIWNLEVPGSNPPPYYYLSLFSVVSNSTPRPRCVNSQLVSLQPVGILIVYVIFTIFGYLFTVNPISTTDIRHLNKVILILFIYCSDAISRVTWWVKEWLTPAVTACSLAKDVGYTLTLPRLGLSFKTQKTNLHSQISTERKIAGINLRE